MLEQGGCQSFWKIQITITSIIATKRKNGKQQSYIPVGFRTLFGSPRYYKEWLGNFADRQKS